MRLRVAAVTGLALAFAGCGGGGGSHDGAPASRSGRQAASAPASSETAASKASLLGNVLVHQTDDDGTTPDDGTDVMLLFEPDDVATLYVQSADQMLATHGSWSYDDGSLSLRFDTDQLTVDATARVDIGDDTITLPFRVFDGGKRGRSTWKRRPASVADDLRIVFRAALLDSDLGLETQDGLDRATAYAQSLIGFAHGSSGRGRASEDPALPRAVHTAADGIELTYPDGHKVHVLLVSWTPAPANPLALSAGALASEPRVHIDPTANGDTQDDPPDKQAIFMVPLEAGRIISWWDTLTNHSQGAGVVGKTADGFDLKGAAATLEGRGYTVTKLYNEDASLDGLIKTFKKVKDPGLVLFQSHGSSGGYLLTGDELSVKGDEAAAGEAFDKLKDKLRGEGYGALADADDALTMMSVETELKVPAGVSYFVAVGPGFWRWLHDEGVDFSHALFYAAACNTDQEPALREAIAARAYFAFNTPIAPQLAGGILNYFVGLLARHTRSAEEAFYNLVRVVNTGEMIYKEDKLLDGIVPADEGSNLLFGDPEAFLFNGYGSDGASTPVAYATHGWFDTDALSQEQVWWLLYAARWNQNSEEGAQTLANCLAQYWSQDDYGGLASPLCNAANDGDLPTAAEVGYATYLETGHALVATTATLPRWTLNEGS
jgi:hypothetical protein